MLPVEEGILLHLTDDPEIKRAVDELMVRADALQFADPDWREELGHWMGQGVLGYTDQEEEHTPRRPLADVLA